MAHMSSQIWWLDVFLATVTENLLCVCLGISSESFPRDCFNEQSASKDPPIRDGGAWVLGHRAGPACPFLLLEEREKTNRSELHLDLHVSRNIVFVL